MNVHQTSILGTQEGDEIFYTTRMQIPFHVEPLLRVVAYARPSAGTAQCAYALTVEVRRAVSSSAVMQSLDWSPIITSSS